MIARLKGNILMNFLYLGVFYVAYFLLVPYFHYIVDIIANIDFITPYYNNIPQSTHTFMDAILYAVVPIVALIWTIMSSTQPQYQQYG